jgi:hypothetical protein
MGEGGDSSVALVAGIYVQVHTTSQPKTNIDIFTAMRTLILTSNVIIGMIFTGWWDDILLLVVKHFIDNN